MVIVGFDPGGSTSGWAVLSVGGHPAQPVAEFLAKGAVASDGPSLDAFFASCDPFNVAAGRLVAVEKNEGIAFGSKGAGIVPHLIACARADGLICENARAHGVHVVSLPRRRMAQHVCRDKSAPDRVVKAAIHLYVRGWPAKSNVHERDAAGVALAAVVARARGRRARQLAARPVSKAGVSAAGRG